MNKIFGLIVALVISGHATANSQDGSPPFNSLICEANNVNVQVEIQHYRQTYGAGTASIESENSAWGGGWHWRAAEQGTRLTGYHFLTIKANSQNQGPVFLNTFYSPYGKLSGGWLEMKGFSGSVTCEILN